MREAPRPPEAIASTRASGPSSLRAAVVVCAYTMERFADLEATIGSIGRQTRRPEQVIVVVDHHPALLDRARLAFPGVTVIANRDDQGLSGARNAGVNATTADVIAFLDDDVIAEPAWLQEALRPLDDPDIVGVGRTATSLDGCEETELAIRIRHTHPTLRFVREPTAGVAHRVTRNRHSVRYFIRRCFSEGRSKRLLAARVGTDHALAAEKRHALRLLLAAIPRELARTTRGEISGATRAGALLIGLGATTLGYVAGPTTQT